MKDFQLVALNPPCDVEPSVAIAAARAGCLGILSLEWTTDLKLAHQAIDTLVRFSRGSVGIKLDTANRELVESLLDNLPPAIKVVILVPGDPAMLRQDVGQLRAQKRDIWLEVTDIDQAYLGQQLGVDGLIAKGHEAGGLVGHETTFILLQRIRAKIDLPVWAQGGIGLHTAAACYAAGAAGVVLDAQLWLTRESPLPEPVKQAIAAMDGSETLCLGSEPAQALRIYNRRGAPVLDRLHAQMSAIMQDDRQEQVLLPSWRDVIGASIGWDNPQEQLWPLGQDAAFAARLAQRHRTVAGVMLALREAVDDHIRSAKYLQPLDIDAPLARSHGTRYPIVQGPMTRVSDTAAFAHAVAEGGGLPFLALALMRAAQIERLLQETQGLLNERPWGVGILGFVPPHLRQEQMEVIRRYRPPFALIAGGRPDQAHVLEREGIPSYLHVPSPGLLRLFLKDGTRRFVFEGRECGGHVGPRSSFVLWNTMIDVLLEEVPETAAADCHILFAGGIHDATSAAMVAALAAPLAARGMHIGVLIGTAYLFTEEAVAAGAIMPGFQEEALRCHRTALLETGPGHATRCAETSFVELFQQEKRRLTRQGVSGEELRSALEDLNLGRLRIASKGITRHPRFGQDPDAPKFAVVGDDEQRQEGMYMIGQVATLHDHISSIEALHRDVAIGGTAQLHALPLNTAEPAQPDERRPCDVAIVGMSCLLPKAPDLRTYWENILNKVDAIGEVPKDRWDWERYFDPDRKARDKIYSRWGGFLEDVAFDPTQYGIPPNALRSIEPIQLLVLEAVRAALQDADYLDRPFPREHTAVILGAGGGAGALGEQYAVRASLPELLEAVPEEILAQLPEWTEDSFPGILLNVIAGRVANRFDLGGVNYTIDAACASSLAAVYLAVRELETGTSDVVITGGVDNVQNPFGFMCFSKTQALSPRGHCRTFDDTADGIAISEGVTVVVLKRLADAERDGDRIYAVIKGVGGSSDGRDRSLTAPRPKGQARSLERAYAQAGISPATVTLIEAHGTGTVVGDQAEVETLKRVFGAAGALQQSCAIGSVKSMIGHTKCAAGVAGLIKVALALYHQVLPPTLGVEQPNSRIGFEESPFYVNSEARPWLNGVGDHPRRAGVSAFGFGGTNFHVVVEEYTGDYLPRPATKQHWPSELFLWTAPSRHELAAALVALEQALIHGANPELHDLAYAVYETYRPSNPAASVCLAIVAVALDDLLNKLSTVSTWLADAGSLHLHDPRGIYYSEQPLAREGKVAFLFPGQGSQYPNMLRDLAIAFGEVRETLERADDVLRERLDGPLSRYVFPVPAFTSETEQRQQIQLTATNVAQPALGAAEMALMHLLNALEVQPDLVAGHSYGEYVALCAAGAIDESTLAELSEARGRIISEAAQDDLGTMAAVQADSAAIVPLLEGISDVWIANVNAPQQTMISGTGAGVALAVERLQSHGLNARPIAVACAFHSPIVAPAQQMLAEVLGRSTFTAPAVEVFSNTTAGPYPRAPEAIAAQLTEHLVQPVRFSDEIAAMYAAGARVFVEVGPRSVLTNLTHQILEERPHAAIAVDHPGRPGLTQLQHALGQLAVQGVSLCLDTLFQGRIERRKLNLTRLREETAKQPVSSTTWWVNGGRSRPLHEPQTPIHRPISLHSTGNGTAHSDVIAAPSHPAIAKAPAQDTSNGHANGQMTTIPQATVQPVPSMSVNGLAHDQTQQAEHHTSAAMPTAEQQVIQRSAEPASSAAPGDTSQVLLQFQNLMGSFLKTQQTIMLTYLQTSAASPGQIPQFTPPSEAAMPLPPSVEVQQDVASTMMQTPFEAQQMVPAAPIVADEAAPAPPVEDQAATNGHLDVAELTAQLVNIVSERTGYPPEMLDLDLDLEASLGIDSIKRVEILGQFRQWLAAHGVAEQSLPMDQLSGLKSLRSIIDLLDAIGTEAPSPHDIQRKAAPLFHATSVTQSSATAAAAPFVQAGPSTIDAERTIQRFTLRAVPRPLIGSVERLLSGRVVLITDDETGVAQHLAARLRHDGYPVALIRAGASEVTVESATYAIDLQSSEAIVAGLERIRQTSGPIGGLIHLLALRPYAGIDETNQQAWRERIALETRSLFLLAKALRTDFESVGEGGNAVLLAASALGGGCGCAFADGEMPACFPGSGALAGLLKTVQLEWPAVRVKAVDLDPREPANVLAAYLLTELLSSDDQVEVGYRDNERWTLELVASPLADQVEIDIKSDWVLLVTGGARGITADAALEVAMRARPTLVLAGRSPLPPPVESADTAGLRSARELKAALIARLRGRGEPVSPAQVEKAYQQILNEREIRENLRALEQAGARVHYHQVDVRDAAAFGTLIDEIYRSFGRLDGVIHGAGIIEDKLVKDKPVDSFDRVLSTKVDSAFVLSRHLRPDSLRFLVFFSSVSARFGNRGQADYAAANEVLNKLAVYLDQRWSARVVAINWGPWEKRGMVSAELLQEFAQRGVTLIPPALGRRKLLDEIRFGPKGAAEVIIGGAAGLNGDPPAPAQARHPLLEGLALTPVANGVEVIRTIDPVHDLYLRDHRIDGKPVFPFAMAMELMAEVVQQAWPDVQVVGLRDMRLFKGLVLEHGPKQVRIAAHVQSDPPNDRFGADVNVEMIDAVQSGLRYYRATVELADRAPEPPVYEDIFTTPLQPFPMSRDDAYAQWLFHGPLFAGIVAVEGIAAQGISATLAASSPQECLAGRSEGQWLIDPVVFDSGLQLVILWARAHIDMTPLPARFRRYQRFSRLTGQQIRCHVQILQQPLDHVFSINIFFVDADGRLVGLLEEMECPSSKALNRLGGRHSEQLSSPL